MQLVFQLSTNCNLRCSYCYQHDKTSAVMSFESAKTLLDDLFAYRLNPDSSEIFYFTVQEQHHLDKIMLDFFGGECTLHIDLMNQICDYFISRCTELGFTDWLENYEISVETNGTTYFLPKVYKFWQKHKDHLHVPISIDGCKTCHDKCRHYADGSPTYDDVEKAVRDHMVLFNDYPDTKLTFSIDNMPYIKESIINLINLGYREIRASFDVTAQITAEQSVAYYNYLVEALDYIIDNKIEFNFKPYTSHVHAWGQRDDTVIPECGTTGTQLVLDYNGNLAFCQHLNDSYQGKEKQEHFVIIGKIENNSIDLNLEAIELFRDRAVLIEEPECMWCPLRFVCSWCPAESLKRFGRWDKPWRQCGVTKAETEAMVHMAKRARETGYPYFKETFDEVLEKIYLDPTMNYLVYRQDREREEQEKQQSETTTEETEN